MSKEIRELEENSKRIIENMRPQTIAQYHIKVIFFLHVSYVDRILNGALTPEVMDLGTHDYIGFLGIDAD